MNEHVNDTKELVEQLPDVAEQPVGDGVVHFQDDSDYHVDPLDRADESPSKEDGPTEVHFV